MWEALVLELLIVHMMEMYKQTKKITNQIKTKNKHQMHDKDTLLQ